MFPNPGYGFDVQELAQDLNDEGLDISIVGGQLSVEEHGLQAAAPIRHLQQPEIRILGGIRPQPGCPRDVTEISTITNSVDAHTYFPGGGCDHECSPTQTLTRINHDVSFDGSPQFKLYFDSDCNLVFTWSGAGDFPLLRCSTSGRFPLAAYGAFSLGFGVPTTTIQLGGDANGCLIDCCFNVAGPLCTSQSPYVITDTISDMSPVIGTYTDTSSCHNGDFSILATITVTVVIA